ncbi:shikimate kinase [Ornithinimicrobium sp. W1665]|uniref:shikimate kinase n=1 Tax=Ornithinimicrobium sp. W1665 TaxID=3416666 RepID=UPI003CE86F71
MSGPIVVLVGPPGAGKSTVGRGLAERWGVPLVDTDVEVETAAGRTISDIFVQDGEASFRDLERAAVLRALQDGRSCVLALGGGAVMQEAVAQALEQSPVPVVFLDVTIADAASRVGFDTSRPLLLVNPRASWTRLMNVRRPVYERLADHHVQTGGRTPAAVVEEVVERVGERQEP